MILNFLCISLFHFLLFKYLIFISCTFASSYVHFSVHSRPNEFCFVSYKHESCLIFKILYIETSNLIAKIRCFCLFSFFFIVCRYEQHYGIIIFTVISLMSLFKKAMTHNKDKIIFYWYTQKKSCYLITNPFMHIKRVITSYYHVVHCRFEMRILIMNYYIQNDSTFYMAI